jgi:hypothetical protein
MLIGIMAISDNKYINNFGAVRGSGKTTTAVHYAIMNVFEKEHTLYSNIHITGLPKGKFYYMPAQKIVEKIVNEELSNVTVLIDEIHLILNSMGEEKDKVMFYLKLFYQARKLNVDIFYTVIRFMDLHVRFREQTEIELMPQKYHYSVDDENLVTIHELCPIDVCQEKHLIKVFSIKPASKEPIVILNPGVIGKYFDTNEFVRDS